MKTSSVRSKKPEHSPRLPQIGVLIETSTTWGRNVSAGIQAYAKRYGPWFVFLDPHGIEERFLFPRGWHANGVIARVSTTAFARTLKALRIPVVNVSGIRLKSTPFPCVTTDTPASGRLAAQYFLDRGFRNFAYFSLIGLHYVARHREAFVTRLEEAGHTCALYDARTGQGASPDWRLNLAHVGTWLRSLPKPVAVLCWNASCSREVLFACQMAGRLVPEEVAILSGCDDDLLCANAHIPISGIQSPAEQIGYTAAGMLDGLMRKQPSKINTILIPPTGIATRRSSDTLALSDPPLVKALGFIRENATNPIQVADICVYAGLSRRALERKFEQFLGRSPAAEIRRCHFEQAKELLATSDMPIPEVAENAGFGSPEYLAAIFRKTLGLTPLKYRRKIRSR